MFNRPNGDRPSHMDALVEDSIAFAWASVAIMVAQLVAAAVAVTLCNFAAARMVIQLVDNVYKQFRDTL